MERNHIRGQTQKAGMESHQIPIVFGDNRGHVVEPEFAYNTAHSVERMDVTSDESFKRLAVSELNVHLPAVAFDQTERIQLPRCAVIEE